MNEPNKFPIVEIFGPTLQGEGREAGMQCSFIRFAHCGFSCSYCDTKYSWQNPEFKEMTAHEIMAEVLTHYPQGVSPAHIILTGGDPAIQKKMEDVLHSFPDTTFSVETQGQIFQSWMLDPQITTITVSPKLANSGQNQTPEDLAWFILECVGFGMPLGKLQVKIVCFTEEDVDEAKDGYLETCFELGVEDVCISTGTIQNEALAMTIDRYRRLTNYCLEWHTGSEFARFRILMQNHVLLWGQKRGV